MIESISIANVATYTTQESLNELSNFNFLFGSNGTGKTTISRIIAEAEKFPNCNITWKGNTKLQTMVYNKDFVDRNFNQSTELKGVFTLGEKQVDTLTKIAAAKTEQDTLTNKIHNLKQGLDGADGLGGKKGELTTLDEKFKEMCWELKKKYDLKLQGAFEGYRNSAEKFKDKVLHEHTSNDAELKTLEELEKKAESVFSSTRTAEAAIEYLDESKMLTHEVNPILKKRVIGKDDVDIAAMIKKLGNSC